MTRPIDAVIDFLKAEQARGNTHVLLDEEARKGLRELYIRSRNPSGHDAPATTGSAIVEAPAAPTLQMSGGSKQEQLESLRQQTASWPPARSLGTLRGTMVFSTGDPDARLMLIGDAPGHEEERKLEPFAGPTGQKLDGILKAMGLSRNTVYITNVLKFRPAAKIQATNNRKPSKAEVESCVPILREEIRIIQPSCIITLGDTATEALLGWREPVQSIRERWGSHEGIAVRVSYHPSCLLQRDDDFLIRRRVWEDMLAAMEKLGLPISEKQRAFFQTKP